MHDFYLSVYINNSNERHVGSLVSSHPTGFTVNSTWWVKCTPRPCQQTILWKILDNIQGVLCTHNTIIYPVEPHLNLCWYSSFSHFYDASVWRISRQCWCRRHIKWSKSFLLCVSGGQAASSCINASLMRSHVKIVLIAGVWDTDYNFQAFWRVGNSVKAVKDSFNNPGPR